jgi:23S rRNA (adenine2503-C2)-methyltransferase
MEQTVKIKEFAKDFNQVNLAISLHAPNDTIRNKIMPISKVYKLEELIKCINQSMIGDKGRLTQNYNKNGYR